jgi:putative ABC transport system permease protein
MVLGQSLLPVLLGLLAGVGASVALGRIMGSLLFGVRAWDPVTISGVATMLLAVAAAATCLPVHRATHVDPASAVRYE